MKIFGMNFFGKEQSVQALIIHPNKNIELVKRVDIRENSFKLQNRAYIVDEKAIYYYKRVPMLIYHSRNASPLRFDNDNVEPSMKSDEIKAVVDSKIAQELLTAAGSEKDLLFWIASAAAGASIINMLIAFGVIKVV